MGEDAGDPFHDRKAQAEAAVALIRVRAKAPELLENLDLLVGRDADARIDHLDPEAVAVAAHADQDAATVRVADGIRDQVHQRAHQHVAIGADHGTGRYEAQRQALALRQRRELGDEAAQEGPQRHILGRPG